MDSDPDGPGGAGRAALVVLCVFGLLVGALAVPPAGAQDDDGGTFDLVELLGDLLGPLLTEDGASGSGCLVAVEERPVPGQEATVVVERADSEPVEGAGVRFNDRYVGRTDGEGRVTGTVPYERTLDVSAAIPHDVDCGAAPGGSVRAGVRADRSGPAPGRAVDPSHADPPSENVSASYTVVDRLDVAIDGEPYPGDRIVVVARVGGEPVPDAAVTADGRTVGRTDRGRRAIRVPDDGSGRLSVRVERGEIGGERTVAVLLLRARLTPEWLVALPGGAGTVEASIGGRPADAEVAIDGRRVGTTDADGRLTVRLPRNPLATVTARAADQVDRVPVWPLYAGTVVAGGVAGIALAAAAGLVVGGLGRLPGAANWLLRAAFGTAARLEAALASIPRSAPELAVGLRSLPSRLVGRVRRGLGALARSLWLVRARLAGATGGPDPGRSGGRDAASGPGWDLRERWRSFARQVAPGEWHRRTPGEIARSAVREGAPLGPVDRLTAVFREVEYGGRPLTERRRERARDALEAIADDEEDDEP